MVAINDLGPVETNAHLLRYDSVHGRFPAEVKVDGDTIEVAAAAASRSPPSATRRSCRTRTLGVDIALECTGLFTAKDKAARPPRGRRQAGDHLAPRPTTSTRPSSTA